MIQTLGRRLFLKGIVALVACISAKPATGSFVGEQPLSLILSSDVRNTRFATGVAQASSMLTRQVSVLQPVSWLQSVQKFSGQRLIGLMDNASFVVFEALMVDLGARFLVTGHHAQGHRFVTVPETAGIAAVIDSRLAPTELAYQLQEKCLGLPGVNTRTGPGSPAPQFSDWSALTGACYARIARGEWDAGLPGHFSASGNSSAVQRDALVSFVVAV